MKKATEPASSAPIPSARAQGRPPLSVHPVNSIVKPDFNS